MWILYAFASALFAGITSILAKCGIKNTDSTVATAIRTVVVLLFAWIMVFVVGSQKTISTVSAKSMIFLILSGAATGASWLCYFKALQLGDVSKVTSIDKTSTIMTIVLAFILLGEKITIMKGTGAILIGTGSFFMVQKNKDNEKKESNKTWIMYAFCSAFFASITAILAKVGIEHVESNLGTAIRTAVVLAMAWIVVFSTKKQGQVKTIAKRELLYICLSGIATGASWLFYYRALQDGPASVVVPIDKLSILFTVVFSYIILREKQNAKSISGLLCITFGTLLMLF